MKIWDITDLGTTTIVGYLMDLTPVNKSVQRLKPQSNMEQIITRIDYSLRLGA